jgi:hypothetical protein
MSFSTKHRSENVELALKQLTAELGSCPLTAYIIVPKDAKYTAILQNNMERTS